LLNQ
jgi:hypothetical protein